MRRYTITHPFFMSFFSKSLYQDVGRNWKGVGLSYLLLLTTLLWIPLAIQMHRGLSDFIINESPALVEQIPAITISEGKVSIDKPEPYFIREPESGNPLLAIDTTGQINSLTDAEAPALLTKTEFIVEKNNNETTAHSLAQIDYLFLDAGRVKGWLEGFRKVFVVFLSPLAVLFIFVKRIIQVLIYAAVGIWFAKKLNTTLSYDALMRLAAVAITPALILSTIFSLTQTSPPAWGLIALLGSLGYLFYAIKAQGIGEAPVEVQTPGEGN